jgi:hypothetical protein
MIKRKAALLSILVVSACGAERDTNPKAEQAARVDPATQDQSAVSASGACHTCAGNGTLDFNVRGEGLAQWEGRRVVAAAIENDSNPLTARRPVILTGTIKNGAFALSCERSLTESYAYPSWAIFIDADGDGRCSNDDSAVQATLYGWNASVDEEIPSASWKRISEGPFRPPLADSKNDFCNGYFRETF